ncbi:Uncharacterised protein [Bordetella pertussis]|nr:Uncharacterised protein [Bordetella pertussis]CFP62632.1 Uncharacterised protein [Bordetella pertussis]
MHTATRQWLASTRAKASTLLSASSPTIQAKPLGSASRQCSSGRVA